MCNRPALLWRCSLPIVPVPSCSAPASKNAYLICQASNTACLFSSTCTSSTSWPVSVSLDSVQQAEDAQTAQFTCQI